MINDTLNLSLRRLLVAVVLSAMLSRCSAWHEMLPSTAPTPPLTLDRVTEPPCWGWPVMLARAARSLPGMQEMSTLVRFRWATELR